MDVLDRAYAKKLVNGLQSGLDHATVDNTTCSITFYWKDGTNSTMTFPKPLDGEKGDKGSSIVDVKLKQITIGTDEEMHLFCILDDGTEIDAGKMPEGSGSGTTDYTDLNNKPSINGVQLEGDKSLTDLGITNYDDTQIKSDIKTLQDTKQNSTDTNLTTNEKAVTGAINEIYGNSLDVVGFSSDYKNIILNRKNGLNPVTIPLVSIISHSKLVELFDIDISDIGNGKTLVYDSSTQKHKYVSTTGTDELVKMEAGGNACYLSDLLDGITLVNDGGFVKAKKLDGQEVTITEINYLKGLTMNVMDLVNMFSNGGVKIINTPVNTYADLLAYDKSSLIDGISYLVYVLTDETHDNAKTTYLIDKTSSVPTYFGFAGEHRDFTTSPINLANEVTGKLGTSNIDVDSLFALLSIDDTYKTLTDVNKVFGTHGANAMYTELVEGIGKKANDTDLTSHTDNTDIHVTPEEKEQFKNKVDKGTVINTKPTSSGAVSQFMVWEDAHGNNFGGMNFVTGDGIGRQFRMSDYEDHMTFIKSNGGTGVEERYKILDERDITNTIDNTSTDTQVPSAKSVYLALSSNLKNTKIMYLDCGGTFSYPELGIDSNNTITEVVRAFANYIINTYGKAQYAVLEFTTNNNSSAFNVSLPNNKQSCIGTVKYMPWQHTNRIQIILTDLINGNTYIGSLNNSDTNDIVWQKVCTTKVADVGWTIVNPTSVLLRGDIKCRVKNGYCTLVLNDIISSTMSTNNQIIATGLPKPESSFAGTWFSIVANADSVSAPIQNLLLMIDLDGNIINYFGSNDVSYFGVVSYPVSES